MKKRINLLFAFVLLLNMTYAQEIYNDSEPNKNDILISLTPNPFWGFAGLNYERQFLNYKKGSLFAETGFGYWQTWGGNGPYFRLKINNRLGKKAHHLETGIGTQIMYDKLSYKYKEPGDTKLKYTDFYPAVSAGYLYNKPQGKFLFKVGFAWPESLYLGFGYAF